MKSEHPQSIEEQLREARARADKEKARADKAEARADKADNAQKAQEAKNNITTYALFVLQRQRIMRNSTGSCRSCSAWNKSHLEDHGY